ncbi:Integrator complex subunit 2 [Cryptotermes secundus]|uniref:Integrator complex subunit 2 n=1 Tax=Cryptotermes secundus TaxID=105785 RepID=A0A2J7Q795_9NEOP|nr:integrator complex subunit 2 [Cryptotermes secundus]PNF24457.1 Integrator complex subunit 2 [Cryptotermes secundus]
MNFSFVVAPRVFRAIQNVDIAELAKCTSKEIRPILPCLVRMSLISPLDNTRECAEGRKEILTLLSGIELVNSIVALLSIDFHALESDVKKEQQMRQKLGSSQSESILIQSLQNGLALEFERSDSTRRLRLVLSELLFISSQIHEQQRGQEFYMKQSDLFDNKVYVEEICDVICIALAELPAVLSIQDVVETLLHVKHGPEIICWVVANSPDCFREVCTSLIANGERQEEDNVGGRIRMQALSMLCQMNPVQALAIRAKCVELCRMPALAITLSLDHAGRTLGTDAEGDMVAFVSGLLLGNDQQVRNWFAMFVRNGQKRKWESHTALQLLREELLRRLQTIILFSLDSQLPDSCVVQASALLRLYCALRGIAGIKFQEDEVSLIVQLLTSHPPPSSAGVRFVSLGLCMLIACPSLIGQQEHEKRSIEWVQWLVREEAYFESASGVTASFGEMLLLMAIHFHSNQLSAICELVCSTLGMKVPIRPNNMTRMKQIFTQEIFTEQVVTSHAVKVPVTANLNANIPGFLPVHCIHQLLKSRAFTKHRVPIKDWIYRQICSSVPPLHPVLPALVEVYVNSVLVPSQKAPQEHINRPMGEDEIRRVFQNSVFGAQFDGKKQCPSPAVAVMSSEDRDTDTEELQAVVSTPSLTSQLLLLYYLLLYEDVRLSNTHGYVYSGRKVKSYSTEFLSELPIKYLLQQAQKDQQSYAGLFSPLLRLLAMHFPHLSLVDDWLEEGMVMEMGSQHEQAPVSEEAIIEAFSHIQSCPLRTGRLLRQLLSMPATDIWPYAETIIKFFKSMLDDKVPRYIQELYKQVWLRLNTVLPRCLWVMSINALLYESAAVKNVFLTQENIVLDPLQVLRCDTRVFRCAAALSVVLRVLEASLAASRSQLSRHLQDCPLMERTGQLTNEAEREELRVALVATQESVAVQILLEACLETEEDRKKPGQLWALREVRSLVCSFLHQVFIADTSLAKLVHFQGYPQELLPITAPGIPSMHICLDFIPELLSQPSLEKQVFAMDLVSHLAVQYALPKSLSVARLAINTLSTLLGVLPSWSRQELFGPCLPALVRICEAFPPLVDDVISLLMQLGRICMSEASLTARQDGLVLSSMTGGNSDGKISAADNHTLCLKIQATFADILSRAVLKVKIY